MSQLHLQSNKPKAVIVGGSIAGVSCAHALILAGWEVIVLEKALQPPTRSPTGAGLGLDPLSLRIIESWIHQPDLLHEAALPMKIDHEQAIIGCKIHKVLTRDEEFNHKAVHWTDLHGILYSSLPSEIFLWGHLFVSFIVSDDKGSVKVTAKVVQTDETIEIDGDLLVGSDGSLSSIRQCFLPEHKLRYSGYCAWRGVLDFDESSETIKNLRRTYPELGKSLYFDFVPGNHTVLFELPRKRLNWLWYVNQPEPQLKGNSVTMKVSSDMVRNMHQEAEKVWHPDLVTIMKETKEPFVNIIYDSDPLEQIFWNNVVLIGDAAHPVTPHSTRSTNMSILDAAVLGKCLEKWGENNLRSALEEYQSTRLPVASRQVLHSRRVGRIKQGLTLPDQRPFDPNTATPEECQELMQRKVPFFGNVPLQIRD